MPNTVSTRIIAKDEATAVFNNLGASIRNNTAAGVLMGNAISGAVGMAANAVGGLTSAFTDAADIQADNIGIAGDYAKLTGASFAEATDQIDAFSNRMAKTAAQLPGATKDYVSLGKGIMDNLIPAFKDANGELDKLGFNDALDNLATAGALRAANSGVDTKDASLAISKLLGGKSISELGTLRFFEQNPAVLAMIEKEAAAMGKTLKEMTAQERAVVAQAAMSVPDEVIEASKQSISGLIEGFKSNLFDPNTGVFGLMRKLDDGSSVLSVAAETTRLIFGEGGVIDQGAKVLSALGLSTDPMELLADGLSWLNGKLKSFSTYLSQFQGGSFLETGIDISSIMAGAGERVAGIINFGVESLRGLDWSGIASMAGEGLAGIVNYAMGFFLNIDFVAIAGLLFEVGIAAIQALGVALINIDWSGVPGLVLKAAGTAVGVLGVAITTGVSALASAIKGAITDLVSRVRGMISNLLSGQEFNTNNIGQGGRVRNSATGLNVGGLMAAIARERAAMPIGSNLVIANDSETILNRQQQRAVIGAASGGGASLNVGNITINAASTADPDALAKMVIDKLGERWQQYQKQQLTPVY